MQEALEFRVAESRAVKYLDMNDGVCLGGSVRKLKVPIPSPLYSRIADLERRLAESGDFFVGSWIIRRKYTEDELHAAPCFQVFVRRYFEPAGEECGTIYDESEQCEYCGAGATQVNDLHLTAKSLPKSDRLAISKTIADEVVVSESFVNMFQQQGFRGAAFRKIKIGRRGSRVAERRYQLDVVSKPLDIVLPTRTGVSPFYEKRERLKPDLDSEFAHLIQLTTWCDKNSVYRCPNGDTIGLRMISELFVDESGLDGSDIAFTRQYLGVRRGPLRPARRLVVTARLRNAILDQRLTGMDFEVCHLMPSQSENNRPMTESTPWAGKLRGQ